MESLEYMQMIEVHSTLELIPSDDMQAIAIELMGNGFNSKSLLALAILDKSDVHEASALLKKALAELGCRGIKIVDALRLYAKSIAKSIIAGEMSPQDGATRIWRTKTNAHLPDFHEFDGFIYAASELEDRPEDREIFESGILAEARSLLS